MTWAGSVIEDVKRVFCSNLKRIREQNNITQSQLSKVCHYDRTYVGKIERGEIDPSLEAIARLAKGLGVRVIDLFRKPKHQYPKMLGEVVGGLSEVQRNQYQSRFADPFDMVAILDRGGGVLETNVSSSRSHEMDVSSLVGKPLWKAEFWKQTDVSAEIIQRWVNRVGEGEDIHLDFPIEFNHDRVIRICFSLTPVKNHQPTVKFMMADLHQILPGMSRKGPYEVV